MTLPIRQQQALNRIEIGITAGDPRLKSMFTTFTRLTAPEAMPATEALAARLPRVLRWPVPVILAAVLAVTVMVGVLLGALAGRTACPGGRTGLGVAHAAVRTVTCRAGSSAEPAGH